MNTAALAKPTPRSSRREPAPSELFQRAGDAANPLTYHAPRITPKVSPLLLRAFSTYSRWYVARHFHSVRISVVGKPPTLSGIPLIIYLNHASWWDPLICLLLQNKFFQPRPAYAPIDAIALEQYRFFAKLGFFGVEQNSAKGAVQFVRAATAILQQSDSVLWLTPQGKFADVRETPVQFKAGLGHLPARVERAAFVPLALEYVFWEERKPEVLCRFGEAEVIERSAGLRPGKNIDWTHHFEQQLAATKDKLAAESQRRSPADFQVLLNSRSGVSFLYDAWRGLAAKLRRREFRREHGRL